MAPLVLVIEDDEMLAESISVYLERHAYATTLAHSGEEGVRLAEASSPEVALVDIRLPGIDGFEVFRRLREISPHAEVIMMTAHASVASAVEAMKQGAFDYLTKPVDLEEVRVVVDKAVAHLRMRQELSYLKARDAAGRQLADILGESSSIQALRAYIERITALESHEGSGAPTVLIVGETGTGKELVARALHYGTPRSPAAFVEVNCAAIPSALLEAELFGCEKGAYTDAKSAKPGLFEAAHGGTLFLDEIGYMDPAVQVKVLKAIEEKSIRRVGGIRSKAINTRIIAATNRDLEVAVAEGTFRADLYYRINVLTIHVPPLRERGKDITLLARHFLRHFSGHYRIPTKELSREAEALLLAQPWPGNVRELAYVMKRALLLRPGTMVTAEDLDLPDGQSTVPVVLGANGTVQVDFSAGAIVLDEVERQLIVRALNAASWNRTRAAQLLGISKETLRYRIEKYQLSDLASDAGRPAPFMQDAPPA